MINVAIVGSGNISAAHANGYAQFPDRCRVVALCDNVPEKARRRRDEWGVSEAGVYASVDELLASGLDIDLVSVCTPPATHAEIVVALLDAGMNVLLEKPMSPSVAECDQMLEAQRRSGKSLSVVAQNRFRDDLAILKAAVDSGLIGPVNHVRVDSAWWRGRTYYDLSWRGTWASEGGGPTLNHAIHHIDLLLWLMGEPTTVAAMMTNAAHDNAEVEDVSVALLQYDRAVAQLTSSVVHHGEQQEIVIQGQHASVAQPWAVKAELAQPNGFPAPTGNTELIQKLNALAQAHDSLPYQGHTGQIDDVLTALESGTAPTITGEDGRRTVQVVTAIYKAAIEGRQVSLPIPTDSPYYRGQGLLDNAPRYFTKSASVDELEGTITVGGSKTPGR